MTCRIDAVQTLPIVRKVYPDMRIDPIDRLRFSRPCMLTTLATFMHADSWPAERPPVRPGNAHPSRGTCAWWPSPQSPDTALTAYVRVCAQIDFDEAVSARRIVIKPTVDEDLDRIKRTYFGLGDFLVRSTCARSCPRTGWAGVCFAPTHAWLHTGTQSVVAREISQTIPPSFAPSLAIVYWPQLGYLIAVPARCVTLSTHSYISPQLIVVVALNCPARRPSPTRSSCTKACGSRSVQAILAGAVDGARSTHER